MKQKTIFRTELDPGPKKFHCAGCGHKTLVRRIEKETGQYLPPHVGRCDRQNKCGYDYTAGQYYKEIGEGKGYITKEIETVIKPEIIEYMPLSYIEKSMSNYKQANLYKWFERLFGSHTADKIAKTYFLGKSNKGDGKRHINWQVDMEGRLRTGKIMSADPLTGKRGKEFEWVHNSVPGFNYKQCFFGEHLIAEFPKKAIAIFESEKTAMIASVFMPDMVCISVGAAIGGCKWREYSVHKVLKDRVVILFPDYGFANKKKGVTCFEEWSNRASAIKERMKCEIKVSTVLEDLFINEERNDQDLADVLIKIDSDTSLAMLDPGYPAIFDYFRS